MTGGGIKFMMLIIKLDTPTIESAVLAKINAGMGMASQPPQMVCPNFNFSTKIS